MEREFLKRHEKARYGRVTLRAGAGFASAKINTPAENASAVTLEISTHLIVYPAQPTPEPTPQAWKTGQNRIVEGRRRRHVTRAQTGAKIRFITGNIGGSTGGCKPPRSDSV
jgi:hypothetical protein